MAASCSGRKRVRPAKNKASSRAAAVQQDREACRRPLNARSSAAKDERESSKECEEERSCQRSEVCAVRRTPLFPHQDIREDLRRLGLHFHRALRTKHNHPPLPPQEATGRAVAVAEGDIF